MIKQKYISLQADNTPPYFGFDNIPIGGEECCQVANSRV